MRRFTIWLALSLFVTLGCGGLLGDTPVEPVAPANDAITALASSLDRLDVAISAVEAVPVDARSAPRLFAVDARLQASADMLRPVAQRTLEGAPSDAPAPAP